MGYVDLLFEPDLDFFLPAKYQNRWFGYEYSDTPSIKHLLESLGVPHTEIGAVKVDSQPAALDDLVQHSTGIRVYPASAEALVKVSKRVSFGEPRFILDIHLGKLARYLRMLGFDALYQNDLDDAALAVLAAEQNRILLTRDWRLLMRKIVTQGCCLRSLDPEVEVTGVEEVEITAGGRAVRTPSRKPSYPGKNLVLSVDIELQKIDEREFGDRRGALIAIEPSSGDVLAFVSKPTFDPNLFVDGIDPKSWDELNNDPDKPLLNRALRGTYPIGSTYKPFLALAALESGKRRPEQVIQDNGTFLFGNRVFRDSNKVPLGPVDLHRSIVKSSDVYYYQLANDLVVDAIHDFMKPWGFGQITGVDVEGEQTGILPSSAWKKKRFKQKWYPGA